MTKNRNTDLWADIAEEVIELSPRQLMKEQAAYLKEKTKGLLVGEVISDQFNGKFSQTFSLVAPTLKYGIERLNQMLRSPNYLDPIIANYPISIHTKAVRPVSSVSREL